MADEPSIPMDQEEEDNDEYFSAKESPGRKGSQECLKSSTPTPQKSERCGQSSSRKQKFFSDEAAQQGSENSSTKKSERRRLKDKNRWDMREYKKEELEAPATPKKKKKKKSKNKKKEEEKKPEEKSKTDEESEDKDEPSPLPPSSDRVTPQPRPFFQSQKLILQTRSEKPITPKCKFYVLRFAKAQEVVEYDAEGQQPLLAHYNERAISNPWRRWGAHRALCDQGGYLVDKNKKLVEIKRGSDPPKCPPNPRQVTLNKNCEAPDSQTMMGTLRVEVGPADEEVHRIAKVMEDYAKNGGFVPPPMTRKEMQAKPAKGQPMVVVQTKGGKSMEVSRKKKSKPAKKKTQSQSSSSQGDETDESCEDGGDSTVEKGKKNLSREACPVSNPPPAPPPMENSRKGGVLGFVKRKKAQIQGKAKKNNKGSQR